MASIVRPFVLLAKATRAFFKADVRLRRGQRGLEVVLDETAAVDTAGKPKKPRSQRVRKADAAAEKSQQELLHIQGSLKRLLDEMPDNRVAMRHLAFIEHALGRKGLRALHKVPHDVLQRALEQLEGLVVNWSDEGLAALRSKMAVAVIERNPDDLPPAAAAEGPVSSLLDPAELVHPEPVDAALVEEEDPEAALRAAYGNVALPDLELVAMEEPPALEVHGELSSPSAQALAKAARRAAG